MFQGHRMSRGTVQTALNAVWEIMKSSRR